MAYDITTIGSLITGTCTCGGRKPIDPAVISGLVEMGATLAERPAVKRAALVVAGVAVLGGVGWLTWKLRTDRKGRGARR